MKLFTNSPLTNALKRELRFLFHAGSNPRQLLRCLVSSTDQPVNFDGLDLDISPGYGSYHTVWEVLGNSEYQPRHVSLPESIDTVVDLGAYVGDFALWAARQVKPRRIISIEMDPRNYDLLQRNIKANKLSPIVTPVHGAIYATSGKAVGIAEGLFPRRTALQLSTSSSHANIPTLSFSDLFTRYAIDHIDFLKIDIEGAEKYIFTEENADILQNRVRMLVFEAHAKGERPPHWYIDFCRKIGFEVWYTPYFVGRQYPNLDVEALNMNLADSRKSSGVRPHFGRGNRSPGA